MRHLLLSLTFIFLIGCGVTTPEYTAPDTQPAEKTTVTVDKPFDEVWQGLISFTSQRFFAIDSYEKASGLMTLTFSAEPERFVDCGSISTDGPPSYEGSYIGWFDERPAQLNLTGSMNLTVQEDGESETTVEVNTRYVISVQSPAGTSEEWAFNTGGSDTQTVPTNNFGATQKRTCRPTHEAERVIVEGVQKEI